MNYIQHTVAKELTWSGRALHSGKETKITIAPAEAGFGIRFKRGDIENSRWVSADAKFVTSTHRSTNIGASNIEIGTIEHVMAALAGAKIDNACITVIGPEIPILDGSAALFYSELKNNVTELKADQSAEWFPRDIIEFVHDETGASYTLLPSDSLICDVILNYKNNRVGDKHASYVSTDDFSELAKARTYVFTEELVELANAGLIKGGDIENAIVIPSEGTGENELREALKILGRSDIENTVDRVRQGFALQSPNELAQHKLLDLIGDLSLIGCRIQAKIIAKKPGHAANIAFVKHLKTYFQRDVKLKNKPIYDPNKEAVLDVEAVKSYLPHRYPFLMVDKIIELTSTMVVGIKNVTFNESLFQGHFPDNAVFPGVLQMEALAQTGGILALSTVENPSDWDTYLLKMDNAKFKRKVLPGDTLILKMELLSPVRRGIFHMKGTTYVGNNIASEGELTAQIVNRKA